MGKYLEITFRQTLLRFKNRSLAKIITRFPGLTAAFIHKYTPWESEQIPWSAMTIPLFQANVALVTTAGVHHRYQEPFDMLDPNGDPTFRAIDATHILQDYTITHDYYDHADADKDLNVVFPFERLLELETAGKIGRVAETHYSFMGHIDGPYIYALITHYAREIAMSMKANGIDIVLLTPG